MILSCEKLTVSYDAVAVSDVSFSVEEGDFICIVGENGSGKTTLIKALLGLIPPKDGKLFRKEGLTVGYVPQKLSVNPDFPASAEEIVQSGIITDKPFLSRKEKETVKSTMKMLEIYDLHRKSFSSLSGGQAQRVLLARALCSSTAFLVLDEPSTGLDPHVTKELYGILGKLNREQNTTVIMVSHDIKASVQMATKILHLDKTVQFFGAPHNYICSECGKRFAGGEDHA